MTFLINLFVFYKVLAHSTFLSPDLNKLFLNKKKQSIDQKNKIAMFLKKVYLNYFTVPNLLVV